MLVKSKPFILAAHEETAAGVRELAFDDPELAHVAGGTSGKVCCMITPDAVFCDHDHDA